MPDQRTAMLKALKSPFIIWEWNLHDLQEWARNFTLIKPIWLTDINQALSDAKQTNRRILAAFVAANCGFCQALETNVFEVSYFAVWAHSHNLILFKHEVPDYHQPDALDQKYAVQSFPTAICFNPNGSKRGQLAGVPGGLGVTAANWCTNFEGSTSLNQTP
jgi:thiol:disulfide interchange protein